jgi:hypothetical protein
MMTKARTGASASATPTTATPTTEAATTEAPALAPAALIPATRVAVEDVHGEKCAVCGERTDRQIVVDHSPRTVAWNATTMTSIARFCSVRCARMRHTSERFDALDAYYQRLARDAARKRTRVVDAVARVPGEGAIRATWHPDAQYDRERREHDALTQESRRLNGGRS